MIIEFKQADKALALDYLMIDPKMNLFAINMVKRFDLGDQLRIYGLDRGQGLEGLLVKFSGNYMPYSHLDDHTLRAFLPVIQADDSRLMISGKKAHVQGFKGLFDHEVIQESTYCELDSRADLLLGDLTIKKAGLEDVDRVVHILSDLEGMGLDGSFKDFVIRRLEAKMSRIYYVENDQGDMIAISQTTGENESSAIIMGVGTQLGYRGMGLQKQCLSQMCSDLLDEGKKVYLQYSNPLAGKIYHKIGFKAIGKWMEIAW